MDVINELLTWDVILNHKFMFAAAFKVKYSKKTGDDVNPNDNSTDSKTSEFDTSFEQVCKNIAALVLQQIPINIEIRFVQTSQLLNFCCLNNVFKSHLDNEKVTKQWQLQKPKCNEYCQQVTPTIEYNNYRLLVQNAS